MTLSSGKLIGNSNDKLTSELLVSPSLSVNSITLAMNSVQSMNEKSIVSDRGSCSDIIKHSYQFLSRQPTWNLEHDRRKDNVDFLKIEFKIYLCVFQKFKARIV